MAYIEDIRTVDVATGDEVVVSPELAAASRCFALLMACAHTIRRVEHHTTKGNDDAAAQEVASFLGNMTRQGGGKRIEADAHLLASMIGAELTVQIVEEEGLVH